MLKIIKDKNGEEISYYTENIEQFSGNPVCTGYGVTNGKEYSIIFEERNGQYYFMELEEEER